MAVQTITSLEPRQSNISEEIQRPLYEEFVLFKIYVTFVVLLKSSTAWLRSIYTMEDNQLYPKFLHLKSNLIHNAVIEVFRTIQITYLDI